MAALTDAPANPVRAGASAAAGAAAGAVMLFAFWFLAGGASRFLLDVLLVALLTAGLTWWYLGRGGRGYWGIWALVGWLFAGFAVIGVILAIVSGESLASLPVAGFYYSLYIGVAFLGIPAAIVAILFTDWKVGRAKQW